jgi:hypothetical protein
LVEVVPVALVIAPLPLRQGVVAEVAVQARSAGLMCPFEACREFCM